MGNIQFTGPQQHFSLPVFLVENHLRQAPASEFKVLIALYYAAQRFGSFGTQDLAALCGLTEVDVMAACEYWHQAEVLRLLDMDSTGNLSLDLNPPYDQGSKEVPQATMESLNQTIEAAMGRPLTPALARLNAELKEDYDFPEEVILLLYGCARGKEKPNYLRAIAEDWKLAGIQTAEDAHRRIRSREIAMKEQGAFIRYIGLDPMQLPQPQMDQISRFFNHYGFDLTMLKHAAERCLNQLGKIDLNYIEGILKQWRDKGIKTIEEAKTKDKPPRTARRSNPRDTTSFNNYEQRGYDFSAIQDELYGLEEDFHE